VLLAIAPKPYQLEQESGPWLSGVAAEARRGAQVTVVSAHTDGLSDVDGTDERLYVGDREVPAVNAANEAFIDQAVEALDLFERVLPQPTSLADADPATAPDYPPDGHVQFFALTNRGLQATPPVAVATIEADADHPLRALYDASLVAHAAILAHQPPERAR